MGAGTVGMDAVVDVEEELLVLELPVVSTICGVCLKTVTPQAPLALSECPPKN